MSEVAGLFGALREQVKEPRADGGSAAVRLRTAQRDQAEFQVMELESLLSPEHPARAVWGFVAALDLSELLVAVQVPARANRAVPRRIRRS